MLRQFITVKLHPDVIILIVARVKLLRFVKSQDRNGQLLLWGLKQDKEGLADRQFGFNDIVVVPVDATLDQDFVISLLFIKIIECKDLLGDCD